MAARHVSSLAWNAAAIAAALGVVVPREAAAQLHGDVSAQVGVMKRFLAQRSSGAEAGFGPMAELTGHVALLPFVHVGGYFGHDISPLSGDAAARDVTFGGVRVKGMIPVFAPRVRSWLFVGFGYAGVYARSYDTTLAVPTGLGTTSPQRVHIDGAGGSFFDLPFGLGASYKLRAPLELCAELAGRAGFGHTGSVYESPGPQVTLPGNVGNATPSGLDTFALSLSVGVLLDL
jgi:hypothetical protein